MPRSRWRASASTIRLSSSSLSDEWSISPRRYLPRAAKSSSGRSKLPTWSAFGSHVAKSLTAPNREIHYQDPTFSQQRANESQKSDYNVLP